MNTHSNTRKKTIYFHGEYGLENFSSLVAGRMLRFRLCLFEIWNRRLAQNLKRNDQYEFRMDSDSKFVFSNKEKSLRIRQEIVASSHKEYLLLSPE